MKNSIIECTKDFLISFWGILPPYKWVEGRLISKEIANDGKYYILMEDQILEIDWLTFEKLMPGEALRLRVTRSNRVISIDRLLP